MLLGLVLAYGAAITSLGLALATWVSRLGRAIALCVTIYVFIMIVWPFAVAIGVGTPAMRHRRHDARRPSLRYVPRDAGRLGPGSSQAASRAIESGYPRSAIVTWIIVLSGVAASLFAATVATFDRAWAGSRRRRRRPPSSRPRRSSPTSAELLALVPMSSEDPEPGEEHGPSPSEDSSHADATGTRAGVRLRVADGRAAVAALRAARPVRRR